MSTLETITNNFILQAGLSERFYPTAQRYYAPVIEALCEKAIEHRKAAGAPLFFGLVGCQGSGKTTLGDYLICLAEHFGCRAIVMSIDDFYLSKAERFKLSQSVHPLLVTRGVPGTHDTQLLSQVLHSLKASETGFVRPQFNKATDDCFPQNEWPKVDQAYDLVVLEGWFWGAMPVPEASLKNPVNALESAEDPGGEWRTYVNRRLQEDYIGLYDLFDYWGFLKAPSFDAVLNWRTEQEARLKLKAENGSGEGIMTPSEIERFIQHYQRITESLLNDMPSRADVIWHLDYERKIKTMKISGDLAKKVWSK